MSKYGAIRTWSNLCNRWFPSKLECQRGEELALLQKAGEITDLEYQVKFVLCLQPRISITIDFSYRENGVLRLEDTKGVLTRDFRTKMAWLEQSQGIKVKLSN